MAGGQLAKPQLRDLHLTRVKRSLALMAVVVPCVGLISKYFIIDRYEQKIEEFYKTYDAMKSLDRMNKAGLMESYPVE